MPKSRTQSAAVSPPPPPTLRLALSIPEFCKAHGISEGFFYKLKKQGEGPREMKVGARTLISFESAAEWRRARETKHTETIVSPIATPIAEKRPRGRRKGQGSFEPLDLPLLKEMKGLISSEAAASPEEAARLLAPKAHGAGSLESRTERLAKRFRSRADRN
jgi:predicted DNA-binding transcriptional regulator AlpA